ncbi:hypothetical protein, partial [Haloferax profundi]|uniref:hypothetical protein n=1 Tax=Haloferax profundi TaxID=1544718 RepID=UPI001E3B9842
YSPPSVMHCQQRAIGGRGGGSQSEVSHVQSKYFWDLDKPGEMSFPEPHLADHFPYLGVGYEVSYNVSSDPTAWETFLSS